MYLPCSIENQVHKKRNDAFLTAQSGTLNRALLILGAVSNTELGTMCLLQTRWTVSCDCITPLYTWHSAVFKPLFLSLFPMRVKGEILASLNDFKNLVF